MSEELQWAFQVGHFQKGGLLVVPLVLNQLGSCMVLLQVPQNPLCLSEVGIDES